MTSSSTVREDPQEVETVEAVVVAVAVTVVAVEETVEAEEVESPSSTPTTRMISQLCEVESTRRVTRVNFKSLDYSHAFRCDE